MLELLQRRASSAVLSGLSFAVNGPLLGGSGGRGLLVDTPPRLGFATDNVRVPASAGPSVPAKGSCVMRACAAGQVRPSDAAFPHRSFLAVGDPLLSSGHGSGLASNPPLGLPLGNRATREMPHAALNVALGHGVGGGPLLGRANRSFPADYSPLPLCDCASDARHAGRWCVCVGIPVVKKMLRINLNGPHILARIYRALARGLLRPQETTQADAGTDARLAPGTK